MLWPPCPHLPRPLGCSQPRPWHIRLLGFPPAPWAGPPFCSPNTSSWTSQQPCHFRGHLFRLFDARIWTPRSTAGTRPLDVVSVGVSQTRPTSVLHTVALDVFKSKLCSCRITAAILISVLPPPCPPPGYGSAAGLCTGTERGLPPPASLQGAAVSHEDRATASHRSPPSPFVLFQTLLRSWKRCSP